MRKYHVYSIDFYGTDKIYIGCTINPSRRFEQHKIADNWLDIYVIPKSIKVLNIVNTEEEATEEELKWIIITWKSNLNKARVGYGMHRLFTEPKISKEEREFRIYQADITASEKLANIKGNYIPGMYDYEK